MIIVRKALLHLPELLVDLRNLLAFVGLFVLLATFFGGVVYFPRASDWVFGDTHVSAHVSGFKTRNCRPVHEGGRARIDGRMVDVRFTFLDDPTPGSSKPLGWQSFGVWDWEHPEGALPERVYLDMEHVCPNGVHVYSTWSFEVPLQ